ncbi:hypothetical protein PPERSA_08369 [Pseudocohnilembus persalinus]|uniref:Uncharacterized protein n=1 Tax=Pseudocohnilembus persalinus TaxID=266149 RepID=A0A0V0R6I5_PSEPJ|nr:hypothetical protein PPERSA_08369 [Pseudocohnilembus persalinus]|eukprot:KRX09968.1 hypothetical protein PPERSA_08369 [Pseudocohnilembus persalinus]
MILNPENQRPAQQKQQQQIKLNKDELISEEENEVDQESDEFLNSEEEEIQEEALDSDSLSIMNQNIKMQKKKGFQDQQQQQNLEIDEEEDDDKKKKPAWMKFFQSSEPMKVDIESQVYLKFRQVQYGIKN